MCKEHGTGIVTSKSNGLPKYRAMGTQQLLLIILGTIIVGIAISIGMTMFVDNAISSNRDAVTMDLMNLAMRAQTFYRRPTIMGGGGNSFVGLTANSAGLAKLTSRPTNANGSYSIQTAGTATSIVLAGVGREKGTDGTFIQAQVTVYSDSLFLSQSN
jgi:hypothetical protein